ncbi:DUF721 domain-containing protein [Shewanella sp. GXUN23E]|uniref:DUF721 domain-containing protein n=1 Tax=Shewanella sp. GXUN23E TaxID=3422498 RepID=UPI003D7E5D31
MKKHPQDLSRLMHHSGKLPSLAEKAELLRQLDQQVKQMLAEHVAQQLQVANLRDSVLVIETTSSAWAARINFQKAMLLTQLQAQTLPMLTAIEVKVNPALARTAPAPKIPQRELSADAAAHIQALAEHTDGSLAQKLKRLAALASRSRQS